MYKDKKILGIIPARGGSKGIPRKNIIDLGGKPLIYHSISESKKSKYLTDLFISTDDNEITKYVESLGCQIIDRPKEISLDTSRTEECLIHAIETLSKKGLNYDFIVVLEPTSPFRKSLTIDKCIKQIIDFEQESLLTVIESYENIGIISQGNYFRPIREKAPRRRQEREPFYIESSTVYISSIDYLLKNKSLVSNNWGTIIINKEESIDINEKIDLEYARFIFDFLKDK